MTWKVKGRVDGLEQLLGKLQDLDKKVRKTVLRKATTAAGQVILKRARQGAKQVAELGLLSKSLGKKVKVYSSGVAVAIVGPRSSFRKPAVRSRGKWAPAPVRPSGYADPVKYAHLVERGTYRTRAHPFIRPAIEGTTAEVLAASESVLKRELGL